MGRFAFRIVHFLYNGFSFNIHIGIYIYYKSLNCKKKSGETDRLYNILLYMLPNKTMCVKNVFTGLQTYVFYVNDSILGLGYKP